MPFTIVQMDITEMKVDAIVNAANTGLQMGGGVCGQIFRKAGAKALQAACDKLAPIRTGAAVITPGFNLQARYVIHAAGPIYRGGKFGEEEQLRSCYLNSLNLAEAAGCESIAFPLISSGVYGYPKQEALRVATEAIRDFLIEHDLAIFLVLYDKGALQARANLSGEIANYIQTHYQEPDSFPLSAAAPDSFDRWSTYHSETAPSPDWTALADERDAADYLAPREESAKAKPTKAAPQKKMFHLEESFSDALLRLIDAKGKNDVTVYKRANLDRRLFSKIRSDRLYMPSKRTVFALAIGLELSLAETEDLLKRAGYAFSHSQLFDVIIEFFISSKIYNIYEINEFLYDYDLPQLGS